jgi:hypothetical protein
MKANLATTMVELLSISIDSSDEPDEAGFFTEVDDNPYR